MNKLCIIEKKKHPLYDQFLYITEKHKISLASPSIWTRGKWEILDNRNYSVVRFETREEAEEWIADRINVSSSYLKNLRNNN